MIESWIRTLHIWWLKRQLRKQYLLTQRFEDIESWSMTKAQREFNRILVDLKALGYEGAKDVPYFKTRDGS